MTQDGEIALTYWIYEDRPTNKALIHLGTCSLL